MDWKTHPNFRVARDEAISRIDWRGLCTAIERLQAGEKEAMDEVNLYLGQLLDTFEDRKEDYKKHTFEIHHALDEEFKLYCLRNEVSQRAAINSAMDLFLHVEEWLKRSR